MDQLEDLRDKAAEKALNICFAAGIVPGISASLPALAAADFTEIYSMDCYFAGEDSWSYGSAYDMTCGMHELSQLGPCMICKGEERKLSFPERVIHFPSLPEPMAIVWLSLFTLRNSKGCVSASTRMNHVVFGLIPDLPSFWLWVLSVYSIVPFRQSDRALCKMLCRASAMDGKRRPPKGYMLCTVIKGICDGIKETKTYWLYFLIHTQEPDWLPG